MANWESDDFMREWDKLYVTTNLKPSAKPYSTDVFLDYNDQLCQGSSDLKAISYSIIAAACSAVGRADVVGKFFDDITAGSSPEESQHIFLQLREAMTCIYPFLGMPSLVPGCFGMIGVLQRKGEQYASLRQFRKPTIDEENIRKGLELRKKIYASAGNSEILTLLGKYFADLYNGSTAFTWGYLLAAASEEVFSVHHTHLIVATAITGLGATRQTRSHLKATMGAGNSIEAVKAMVEVVCKIADWADRPITKPDVDSLAEEARANLEKRKQGSE